MLVQIEGTDPRGLLFYLLIVEVAGEHMNQGLDGYYEQKGFLG